MYKGNIQTFSNNLKDYLERKYPGLKVSVGSVYYHPTKTTRQYIALDGVGEWLDDVEDMEDTVYKFINQRLKHLRYV